MEIGRKSYTENEFHIFWIGIYKELNNLYTNNECNTLEVYNNIFALCTSMSNLETKLYWKIGDFLYAKCADISAKINQQEDKIYAYCEAFEKYKMFVLNLDKMCFYLNDCVQNKTIKTAAFLLWEKSIIQSLPNTFFDDVYWYKTKKGGEYVRIKTVESLKYIVPLDTDPLLYYIQKYEIQSIENVKLKYKHIISVNDLQTFCATLSFILTEESKNMQFYFLPESFGYVEKCLESLIFGHREDRIIKTYSTLLDKTYSNKNWNKEDLLLYNEFENRIDATETDKKSNFYENEIFKSILILLEKGIQETINSNEKISTQGLLGNNTPLYVQIFAQLLTTSKGFVLIKKTYAHFIYTTLENNKSQLEMGIENIYEIFKRTALFDLNIENNDNLLRIIFSLKFIHEQIFKKYLERIKPCFIDRLAKYTDEIYGEYAYNKDKEQIFLELVPLVANTKEFITIYKDILCKRILTRQKVNFKKEFCLMKQLKMEEDQQLINLVKDLQNQPEHIKLLNNMSWNLQCEYSHLLIPDQLFEKIKTELPGFSKKFTSPVKCDYSFKSKEQTKTVNFAHQHSTLIVKIHDNMYKISMYQYILLDMLKQPHSPYEIYKKMYMSEKKIDLLLKSLVDNGLVSNKNGEFQLKTKSEYSEEIGRNLDQVQLQNGNDVKDISKVDLDFAHNHQVDATSYFLALFARVMKEHKKLTKKELVKKAEEQSKYELNEETINKIIEMSVDKGFMDIQNEICVFIM